MRGMRYAVVIFISAIYSLATFSHSCLGQQEAHQLGSAYNRLVEDHQQGSGFGWLPKAESWETTGEYSEIPESEDTERERVRSAYRESYSGRITPEERNLYWGFLPQTKSTNIQKATTLELPYVEEKGELEKNFVVMFSASWCGPCKRMYPLMLKLREQGYAVYVYTMDSDEFKDSDLDAKFNVTAFPTFIIFDKGVEVKRSVGSNSIEYFQRNLKTRKEQGDKYKL